MRLLRFVLPLVILSVFASCEVKIPKEVIPPAEMEALLYDYHLVQSMSGEYSSADYKEKLFFSYIFKKHGVDNERFEFSMQWYNRYPKHLRRIYTSLSERLEAEVSKLDDLKVCQEEGVSLEMVHFGSDNVDLWTSSKIKQFSSNSLNNRLVFSFSVPNDTTFLKGDSLSFSFNAEFFPVGVVRQEAIASIRLDYDDDSYYTTSLCVDTVGVYGLSAPRNFDCKLKSMNGFVYYTDNDTTAASRMLLHNISLVRIHPSNKK